MVDFQSRDTSRGLSSGDDGDEDEGDEETESVDAEPEETVGREETVEGDESADAQPEATSEVDSEGETVTDGPETEPGDTATAGSSHGESNADVDAGPDLDAHDEEAGGHEHDDHGSDHAHGHGHDDEHGHDNVHADHHHGDVEQLGVAVVTVSSSRDLDDDPSGDAIQSLVESDGHSVVARDLVPDDLDGVQRAVLALTGREDVDVVVTTGGTGVTPDDVTVEAVRPLFDKELPGFGELFRILSYEEVGTRAMGSRATGGVSEGVPVFCLPGSEDAVRTGVEELILAEAPHLVGLARDE